MKPCPVILSILDSFVGASIHSARGGETLPRATRLTRHQVTARGIFCLQETQWKKNLSPPSLTCIHIGAHLSLSFDEPKWVLEINLTSAWATVGFSETLLCLLLRV